MQCPCGSEWFLEEKLVRPAGIPANPQRVPLSHREPPIYRYRCSACGLEFGKEKPAEEKPAVSTTETPQPAQRRRGRPPKAAE